MDTWRKQAIVSLESDLKVNLSLAGLLSRLERPAGGFMTEDERRSVEEVQGKSNQVGKIIEVLRGKGNRDFDAFLNVLRESGNELWAEKLDESARQFEEYHKAKEQSGLKAIEYHMDGGSDMAVQLSQGGQVHGEKGNRIVYVPVPVLQRKRSRSSASSGDIPSHPAEKRKIDEYMKMKMDLERQDMKSMHTKCDRVIRLLYANALSRIIRLLEPHLHVVKEAANTYLQLGLHEEEEYVKLCDIQSAGSISELLNRMSVRAKWESTCFLQQAVDAIPAKAIERDVADAILSHYNLHLAIYERATLLKDDLTKKKESENEDEKKQIVATTDLVPVELTSFKSLEEFTCEDCHRLQVRILSQVYGIPAEKIICCDAVERQSTTVTFLVPNEFAYIIMQCTTQLETVWILLELSVIEVAISGFTFKPTMGCFLTLLRGSKPFTADLLGVTEILPYQMHCLVDLGSKEPLSGQPLDTKRIAQHWRLHDMQQYPQQRQQFAQQQQQYPQQRQQYPQQRQQYPQQRQQYPQQQQQYPQQRQQFAQQQQQYPQQQQQYPQQRQQFAQQQQQYPQQQQQYPQQQQQYPQQQQQYPQQRQQFPQKQPLRCLSGQDHINSTSRQPVDISQSLPADAPRPGMPKAHPPPHKQTSVPSGIGCQESACPPPRTAGTVYSKKQPPPVQPRTYEVYTPSLSSPAGKDGGYVTMTEMPELAHLLEDLSTAQGTAGTVYSKKQPPPVQPRAYKVYTPSPPPPAGKDGGYVTMTEMPELAPLLEDLSTAQGSTDMKPPINEMEKLDKKAISQPLGPADVNMLWLTDDDPRQKWTRATSVHPPEEESGLEESDGWDELTREALTIHRSQLSNLKAIGKGQYGQVFYAQLRYSPEAQPIEVAMKSTKQSAKESEVKCFKKVIKTMASLCHPNVVKMYGMVEEQGTRNIVLEYLALGDLKEFLKKNARPVKRLVKYMYDVAAGMHYLASKGLVHRNLAARNVLVSSNEVCKVADMALLREVDKQEFYMAHSALPLPLRWMAPECLEDLQFSTASDVWSFGIFMWELFHPKEKHPYPQMKNSEVRMKVTMGYTMQLPEEAPPIVQCIMKECCKLQSDKRPSFLLISTLLFKCHLLLV